MKSFITGKYIILQHTRSYRIINYMLELNHASLIHNRENSFYLFKFLSLPLSAL